MLTLAGLLAGCGSESPDLQAFRDTAGTRLYEIELDGTVQGHMAETRSVDAVGQPAIRTITELELPGTGRTRRSETLTFAGEPPHALLARRIESRTPDGRIHVRLRSGDGAGVTARGLTEESTVARSTGGHGHDAAGDPFGGPTLGGANGDQRRRESAAGERLADHLAPSVAGSQGHGAVRKLQTGPDAERLVRGADGFPAQYRIGRSFLLRRVDALPPLPPPARPETLTVPVAAAIGPREAVDTLRVRIDGPAATLLEDGPGLALGSTPGNLRTHRLAADLEDSTAGDLIRAAIATVRARLRYVPGASPPDLRALLETGEGDCWEFAALFDALARGSGLQTRTVTGLAWMGDAAGAFGLHAWNEVRVDGRWHGVDATFDQLRADGARIRFPDDPVRQLDLQYALAASTLSVLAVNGRAPSATASTGDGTR